MSMLSRSLCKCPSVSSPSLSVSASLSLSLSLSHTHTHTYTHARTHIFHCCCYFSVSSYVRLFVTPWTAACQASLSINMSQSLPKFMSMSTYPIADPKITILSNSQISPIFSSLFQERHKIKTSCHLKIIIGLYQSEDRNLEKGLAAPFLYQGNPLPCPSCHVTPGIELPPLCDNPPLFHESFFKTKSLLTTFLNVYTFSPRLWLPSCSISAVLIVAIIKRKTGTQGDAS